jgi:predicted acyl esterase
MIVKNAEQVTIASECEQSGGPVDNPDRTAEDGKLLTYTSEPLEQILEVTGARPGSLFISSHGREVFHGYRQRNPVGHSRD